MSAITTLQAQHIAFQYWNLSGTATTLSSEWGGTFRISDHHNTYLLKVAPAHLDVKRVNLEIVVIKHLMASQSILQYPALIRSLSGDDCVQTEHGTARMYSWIDGKVWSDVKPHDPALLGHLGISLGHLSKALIGFDHPAAHDIFLWSIESDIWKDAVTLLPDELKSIGKHYLDRYEHQLKQELSALRHGVLYHDANDHNIIVSHGVVKGFIDYGDCHFGPVINELAICLAYALMDQDDIAGASRMIVKGYHTIFPLEECELEVLHHLICLRLIISLAHSAKRQSLDSANAYWQVSARPAEILLRKLHEYNPNLFLYSIRAACGYEPVPHNKDLRTWLQKNQSGFFPVLGFDLSQAQVTVFDWSVGSPEPGGLKALDDLELQTFNGFRRIRQENAQVGIGRYDEPRPIYTSQEYVVPGLQTPSMRTIHIGIDLIMPAGTPVYAPIDGRVVTLVNNAGDKKYGPLVILRHETDAGLPFFTLYGHNNIYTLSLVRPGQEVKAGEKIGEIGDYPENGNWVPHLHFQIISDLLGYVDDYPGVSDPEARDIWLSLCPDPNLILGISHQDLKYHYADTPGLLRKRQSVLGRNLSLSYDSPLHIVRGWQTHLYDEYGRTYLDTVNNIAHIGHEHPRIVEAAQKQLAVLNTNTRYLHRHILTLSQQILETLPGHLEVVWFVNSGSEANELALRIARAYTGNPETLVLEEGYHGNTQACIDVSHYKFKKLVQPQATHVIPMAVYGQVTDLQEPNMGVGEVTDFAKEMKYERKKVGAGKVTDFAKDIVNGPMVFIHESLPSCAGQIVPHEDFFMDMYAEVKRQGGICIADEVQSGLGRVGSHFWAFELFTIAPDIVTIGKPLGNGHPVAAVACTRALAEHFANGPEFFSSFGGNPVSCAIASEVLSVIENEGLQQHALETGAYWMSALRELQSRFPVIADVRGHGLFIGIEFGDNSDKSRSKSIAGYIQRRMLDHRILTSLDGPHGNVMKIKPPMCITRREVDQFLQVFEKVMQEDRLGGHS